MVSLIRKKYVNLEKKITALLILSSENKIKLIFFLLVLLGSIFVLTFKSPNLLFNVKWRSEMIFFGGETAYTHFKESNTLNSSYIQHKKSHQFGLLLFKQFGLKGISFCDDAYGYGCYHNLIGAAIVKKGLSSVEKIASECAKLSSNIAIKSCQHGIGHGLIGYFGYGVTGVNQAIQLCDQIKNIISPNDCGSGIFMEYNFQDMSTSADHWRKYNASQPYEPCDNVNTSFQPICYFQQASWWLKTVPGEQDNKLIQIDSFCSKLSEKNQTECYKGLGYYLGTYFDWDVKSVIDSCTTLVTAARQSDCLLLTAEIFANGQNLGEKGKQICQTLSTDSVPACLQKIGMDLEIN